MTSIAKPPPRPGVISDMGDSQAIPDNLYRYSSETTAADDDLKTWIISVLGPLIQRYRADTDLYGPLVQIHDLDKWVHDVGAAFQKADANPIPGGSVPDVNLVTTDESTLEEYLAEVEGDEQKALQIQRAKAWGKGLADYTNGLYNGPDDYVWQQLKEHLNDPYYLAAFFNNLSDDMLTTVLSSMSSFHPELIQTLIVAYENDLLNQSVTDNIVSIFQDLTTSDDGSGQLWAAFRTQFLQALEKDPTAAYNFVSHLSNDQLQVLVNGQYALTNTTTTSQTQAEFINVLTAAMQGAKNYPSLAAALFQRVKNAILNSSPCPSGFMTTDSCDPTSSYDAIQQFIMTYEQETLGPPSTNATPADLRAWANGFGSQIAGDIGWFVNWIGDSDKNFADAQARTESMTVGAITTLATFWMGPVSSVASGVATTWLSNTLEPWIHQQTGWPAGPNASVDQAQYHHAMKLYAQGIAMLRLIASGKVQGPDGKVLDITDSNTLTKVWDAQDSNQEQFYVTGTNEPIWSVLDGVGTEFS